jgi:hypothetical protein
MNCFFLFAYKMRQSYSLSIISYTTLPKNNKINTTFAGILLHNTKYTTSDVEKMKTKKVAVR